MSESSSPLEIRRASDTDFPAIRAIYDHYVEHTAITFDLEPWNDARAAQWFAAFGERGPYQLLVGHRGGALVGFAGSRRFRERAAYDTSVETLIYMHPDRHRSGHGTALYRELFAVLDGEYVHRAYAGITLPNPASVALHEKLGFVRVGTFREVGFKHGRYWNVGWFERPVGRLPEGS